MNTIRMRCKAFAGEPVQEYFVRVEDNGQVLVADDVAGHYTTCHEMPASAMRRARRLAKQD